MVMIPAETIVMQEQEAADRARAFLKYRETVERTAAEREALIRRLRIEAQIHAQEARTANATIAAIYQAVTGKTGEPGNWNGAEPVKAEIARLNGELNQLREILQDREAEITSLREKGN